jgi:hypothetical protein
MARFIFISLIAIAFLIKIGIYRIYNSVTTAVAELSDELTKLANELAMIVGHFKV